MMRSLSERNSSRDKYNKPVDLKSKMANSKKSTNVSLKSKLSKFKKGETVINEGTLNNNCNKKRKIKVVLTSKNDK